MKKKIPSVPLMRLGSGNISLVYREAEWNREKEKMEEETEEEAKVGKE